MIVRHFNTRLKGHPLINFIYQSYTKEPSDCTKTANNTIDFVKSGLTKLETHHFLISNPKQKLFYFEGGAGTFIQLGFRTVYRSHV